MQYSLTAAFASAKTGGVGALDGDARAGHIHGCDDRPVHRYCRPPLPHAPRPRPPLRRGARRDENVTPASPLEPSRDEKVTPTHVHRASA
eukprot:6539923-Pyramimonas_sp.AAC.1